VSASGGDKTEAPTPKRKKEAREKGQVARSPELTAWSGLLVATFLLRAIAAQSMSHMQWLMNEMRGTIETPDPRTAMALFGEAAWRFGLLIVPLMLGLLLVGVVGGFLQVGLKPSSKLLKPKWKRVNPFKGLKRLVSPMSAWEGAKSTLKVGAIAAAAFPPLRQAAFALAGADRPPLDAVAGMVGTMMITIMRNAALAGLGIAAADYLLQKRKTLKGMKMSKQEIRDEHKQSEGDPMLKGAIRDRQMRMSRNRMMADVATADAVIVNPTHIAVALKYDPALGAPRVVAKGAGAIATKIREQAENHGVPLVRDVPLARTLHKVCEVGSEVPLEMYEAVARLLAFVYALKAANLHRGTHELVAA
jgi:flagellar biosynthetic protein FlhB